MRATLTAADIPAPKIAAALEIAEKLAEAALPFIQSYFDPPQSLAGPNPAADDLQRGCGFPRTVEQATAADFGEDKVTHPR